MSRQDLAHVKFLKREEEKEKKREKSGGKYTWATGWLVERVEDGREGYMVLTGRAQEGRWV